MSKVILFGNINLNLIDGSAIWLVSLGEALSEVFDEVHMPLAVEITNDRLIKRLQARPNVTLHKPENIPGAKERIPRKQFPERIDRMQARIQADVIIARGMDVCTKLLDFPRITERLWAYVTDLPFPVSQLDEADRQRFAAIVDGSRRVFAQTEGARSYIETIAPGAAGKTDLMPPIVLEETFAAYDGYSNAEDRELRLVYSGKFAKDWRTLEMLDLPAALRRRGIESELRVMGDKFQNSADDPTWSQRMRDRIAEVHDDPDSGVTWLGGVSREASLDEIARADIGLCWRTRVLDSALEISTKVLEYSASGTAPVINRTADNVRHFGSDYPMYVTGDDDVESLADAIVRWRSEVQRARRMAYDAAKPHSMEHVVDHYRRVFARTGSLGEQRPTDPVDRGRVLFVAADPDPLRELVGELQARNDLDVGVVRLGGPGADGAKELRVAQVVIADGTEAAEWALARRSEGTEVIARLSASDVVAAAEGAAVPAADRLVVGDEAQQQALLRILGAVESAVVGGERVSAIAEYVDALDLDRPKDGGSQFHLGVAAGALLGDGGRQVLDLFGRLVEKDERYVLHVKGAIPVPSPERESGDRTAIAAFFSRIAADPVLRARVWFDAMERDLGNWFRQVGIVLLPAFPNGDDRFALSGMASGAVPVVWDLDEDSRGLRDCAIEERRGHVESLLELRTVPEFDAARLRARSWAARYDIPAVVGRWSALLEDSLAGPGRKRLQASLIMATKDGADRIRRMLDSVAAQTLPAAAMQVIVVENGAKDGTEETVAEFAAAHPELDIVYLFTETSGAGHARNLGLDRAEGAYITFIDDDDYLEPNYLLSMLRAADAKSVVVGPLREDRGDGEFVDDTKYNQDGAALREQGGRAALSKVPSLLSLNACKLIPSSLLGGLRYDETMRSGEDIAYMAQLLTDPETEFVSAEKLPDSSYVRVRRERSVSRPTDRDYDFAVLQRAAVIDSLEALRGAHRSEATNAALRTMQGRQAWFIKKHVERFPADATRVKQELGEKPWAGELLAFLE